MIEREVVYIEGDGVGSEITPMMINVLDSAMAKAYGGNKKLKWTEVYAGGKAEDRPSEFDILSLSFSFSIFMFIFY